MRLILKVFGIPPSIENVVKVAFLNRQAFDSEINGSLLNRLGLLFLDKVLRRNNRKGSRKNISSHYDVSNDFYSLWLDNTMTYSSALFADGSESLEEAQLKKYDRLLHLTRKLWRACSRDWLRLGWFC